MNAVENEYPHEVKITQVINAPRDLVFQAWTDASQVREWWGPDGFTNPRCDWDAVAGGGIHIDMRGPDGVIYPMNGTFHEVLKPERIVFTSAALDAKGAPLFEVMDTVLLAEKDGQTTVEVHAKVEKTTEAAGSYLSGMDEGWKQTVGRLAAYVETRAAENAGAFVMTRVFDAPIDLVWQAHRDPKMLEQWFGPKGFTVKVEKMEFHPGGMYHYSMMAPDGHQMFGRFVYQEIKAPEKLVSILSFSDANAGVTRHPMSATWPLQSRSTMTLKEHCGQTTMTIQNAPHEATEEERRTFAAGRDSMKMGMQGMLDQLGSFLATVPH